VTGCDVTFNAIGDLDYDGSGYYADWPDSVRPDRFPSTFLQFQPTTVHGRPYSQIQFVTDNSATQFETNCDMTTGANCVLPPPGPGNFYPYFTLARVGYACAWEFGNMRNGNTFGGDATVRLGRPEHHRRVRRADPPQPLLLTFLQDHRPGKRNE
jgi:hypothetical protein